jgi:hypothetical protein
MGKYQLPITRVVAEASIRKEIQDIAVALEAEAGLPAEINITVRKRSLNPHDNGVLIDVKVNWKARATLAGARSRRLGRGG